MNFRQVLGLAPLGSMSVAVMGVVLLCGAPAQAAMTAQHFWHMGEDGTTYPADSVGSNPIYDGFGNVGVDATRYVPGSTASLRFGEGDGGANGGRYINTDGTITVPDDNWALELSVMAPASSLAAGGSIITLGSDDGTFQIGIGFNSWFFGEMNQSFGFVSDTSYAPADTWVDLAWVRADGMNLFYIDGQLINFNFDTGVNNGRIHLGIKPGNGEWFTGNLDEIRFSTFASGAFLESDLLANSVVPEPAAMASVVAAAALLCRRARRR